jgi:hypothetical protein
VSRFLLRCTITATALVALSSSAVLGQSAPTVGSTVPDRAMPTLLAPETTTPVMSPPTMTAPAVAPPTMMSPAIEPQLASPRINDDVASIVRRRAAFNRAEVLMITGGALLLTGLIVDGDASTVLVIAGAGIGGYGLYLFLQSPDARLVR